MILYPFTDFTLKDLFCTQAVTDTVLVSIDTDLKEREKTQTYILILEETDMNKLY